MPRGSLPGERRGGRQKGTPNRATAAKAAAVAASGLTPLDYMLSVLRDEAAPRSERMEAAVKAAPFVHPRLAAIEYIAPVPDEELDLSKLNREERAMLRQLLEKGLSNGTGSHDPPGRDEVDTTGSPIFLPH